MLRVSPFVQCLYILSLLLSTRVHSLTLFPPPSLSPSYRTTARQFIRKYDLDGDGRLNLQEFREADAELHATWRFRPIWGAFARADVHRDGVVSAEELVPLLPLTVGDADAAQWLEQYDKAGIQNGLTIGDFPAFTKAVLADNMRNVINTSITMSIFLTVRAELFTRVSLPPSLILHRPLSAPLFFTVH